VRRALAALVVVPSCWVVTEWIRSWQGIGGPWAVFGASQWQHPALLALAAAGAKDLNDAEWYWSVARSLFPKFAGSNLAVYGAAGEAVMRLDRSDACKIRDLPSGARVTPPKPSHSPMPPYPYHALETGIAEPITVEVTVTENGTTRCPKVIETHDDPALAWVLLEAMKKWRYEPARVDGAPVPATVRQTVDFRIKYY